MVDTQQMFVGVGKSQAKTYLEGNCEEIKEVQYPGPTAICLWDPVHSSEHIERGSEIQRGRLKLSLTLLFPLEVITPKSGSPKIFYSHIK